jgi:membrane protein YdbS with pleckstrin-like domain
MAALLQFLVGVLCGLIAGFITYMVGVDRPWPVIIGCIVALAVMGVTVLFVEGDVFD